MEPNRYVRPNLTATRNQIPDPAIEIEGWLDRLEELRARGGAEADPLDCYDLLALWARIRRTRPELVAQLAEDHELSQVEEVFTNRGSEQAWLALTVPNPPAWREETEALESSYEELIDPAERSALAERLLTDLDDAELVLYAARRNGVVDPHLDEELSACRSWLMNHPDLFLPAGIFIQAVAMTFRPDLAEEDYDLALTALKYERLLDTAEEAEAELSFAGIKPLAPSVVRELAERLRLQSETPVPVPAEPRERTWLHTFVPWLLPAPGPLLATGAPEESTPTLATLRWTPATTLKGTVRQAVDLLARAVVPARPLDDNETVLVGFYHHDGTPATELAGQPVTLGSVPGTINEEGVASFEVRKLRERAQPPVLCVGSDQSEWQQQPAT